MVRLMRAISLRIAYDGICDHVLLSQLVNVNMLVVKCRRCSKHDLQMDVVQR